MYKKVSTDMNFAQREKEVLAFWKEHDILKKNLRLRADSDRSFTFFDGPPTANGRPHIGHVETRAIKDLIPRYKTMKGYNCLRKAGWDTHGLPVELEVEKKLGARRQAPDREVRHRALHQGMQVQRVEIPARVGGHVRAGRLLDGHGASLRDLSR